MPKQSLYLLKQSFKIKDESAIKPMMIDWKPDFSSGCKQQKQNTTTEKQISKNSFQALENRQRRTVSLKEGKQIR